MDILNKAKESFAAAGKGFTQKASDVSGLAKVTMKIKEEEKQLEQSLRRGCVACFLEIAVSGGAERQWSGRQYG